MAEPLEMSIRLFLEPEEEAAMPADGALGNWLDRSHSLEIFSGRAIPSAFSAPGSDDWFSNMRQRRHERHARLHQLHGGSLSRCQRRRAALPHVVAA